jgi:enoyl-CoA hydratase
MSDILTERPHATVGLVRLNRPKRMNALSNALVDDLCGALEAFVADGVHAIVIAGDARAFAAGAEITELPITNLEAWDRIDAIAVPLIAAVRGVALGGGLELAMACDMLVVAETARLGQPEIKLGVMPGAGGTQRLTRAIGKALAMEMVLTGRELDGREAFARGLANRCVPSERVDRTALDLALLVAAQAPLAARRAKAAIIDAYEGALTDTLVRERVNFRFLANTDDAREGIAAFTEKRTPTWSGR